MNGSSFSGSLEAGYPIPLGWQDLTLEPQAQFVYQNLNFAPQTDVDGVTARLRSVDQGVFRGGTRLIRPFVSPQGDLVTPYLTANVLQGIGGGDAVNIGSAPFVTGRFGTSVQVGGLPLAAVGAGYDPMRDRPPWVKFVFSALTACSRNSAINLFSLKIQQATPSRCPALSCLADNQLNDFNRLENGAPNRIKMGIWQ